MKLGVYSDCDDSDVMSNGVGREVFAHEIENILVLEIAV